MQIDYRPPAKLYRYSERRWLERSLHLGEFRLRPASEYHMLEADKARKDNELVRIRTSSMRDVKFTLASTGQEIRPISDLTYTTTISTDYLTLCFSENWNDQQFEEFSGTDSCLVVHNVNEFRERLYVEVENVLPNWAGMDGRITYGSRSPLGAVFSKPIEFSSQLEWRFSWLPEQCRDRLTPIVVRIGSIKRIAEIRYRSASETGDA